MAFTSKERDWWLRVYIDPKAGKPRCAFPRYNEQKGWFPCETIGEKNLQIHHIVPTGWIHAQEPWVDSNSLFIDEGKLGIALCKFHHLVTIHPDMGEAMRKYGDDKESIRHTLDYHHELAMRGEKYWRDDFDEALANIAAQAVLHYIAEYPNDHYPKDVSKRARQRPKKPHWTDEFFRKDDHKGDHD